MNIDQPSKDYCAEILRDEGLEYAIFDEDERLIYSSIGLGACLLSPPDIVFPGQDLQYLFPEFIGYEQSLQDVMSGALQEVKIARVFRENLHGGEGYVTLHLRLHKNGLLLVVRDATAEGQLEQKVTQQRNELSLLSNQLAQARSNLDVLLRRFVPSAVVDDMLSDTRKSELGGQRQEITILFADLHGFTSWAEIQEPEKVMDVLNGTLEKVVGILLEEGATLDKFMGDAILAIFNAPAKQSDHVDRALQSARRIGLSQPHVPELSFGIGVNTGFAVVGNIGTTKAMNYTVLGDVVNIAKRLEEITEPGQVFIGPRTHELADPDFSRIPAGRVQLRGRKNLIHIHELIV